jgi:hypothetical protein
MATSKTRAILNVLRRGREEKIASSIMRVFGASSLDECNATYDAVGAAERATLDDAVQRVAADAGAAFWLSVDNESS